MSVRSKFLCGLVLVLVIYWVSRSYDSLEDPMITAALGDHDFGHWSGLVSVASRAALPHHAASNVTQMISGNPTGEPFTIGLFTKEKDWIAYQQAEKKAFEFVKGKAPNLADATTEGQPKQPVPVTVDFTKHNVVFIVLLTQSHSLGFERWSVSRNPLPNPVSNLVGTLTVKHTMIEPYYLDSSPAVFTIIPKGGYHGYPLLHKFVWQNTEGQLIGEIE